MVLQKPPASPYFVQVLDTLKAVAIILKKIRTFSAYVWMGMGQF